MNNKDKKQQTIVYLATYFHPFKGGAENTTLELALQAIKDGYDVHVITSNRCKDQKVNTGEEIYKGIKIHRMKTWFRVSLNLVFYPALFWNLLKIKSDVIIVNYLGIAWHDFCLIIKKLISPKTKFISVPIDEFMGHDSYPFYQRMIKAIYIPIQRLFISWLYDAFIQINPNQHIWMGRDFNIKKEVVKYVPVGLSKSAIKKCSGKIFIKNNHLEDKLVMTYIGRLAAYKGITHVIQIMPNLLQNHQNLVFIIGGRPNKHQAELKLMVNSLKLNDYVIFIDEPTDEEKFDIYAASSIFVSPSSSEGFGITYLEAMSQNNAIVTYKNEGSRFLMTDTEHGFICPNQDKECLEEKILYLIENPDVLSKIQQNNLKLVKDYTWEKIGKEKYLPLLERVLD